jgi:hypothetical protein
MGLFRKNRRVGTYRDESNRGSFAGAGMKTEQDPNYQINHHTPGAGSGQNDAMNYGNYTGEQPGYWPNGPSGGVYFGPGEREED